MAEARKRLPILASLDDESFVRATHAAYYQHTSIEQLAASLCIEWPPTDPRRKLGALEKWRYEACQSDAAQAPTSQGVNVGLRICREKFGQ
jgi:hypothetical protein